MADRDAKASAGDSREAVPGELVVTCGDASEMLELVEEALDQVTVAVELGIDRPHDLHIALRRDVGGGAAGCEQIDDGAGAVAAVGDGIARGPQAIDEGRQRGLVGRLAGRQDQSNREAIAIDDGMDSTAWILVLSPPREQPMA